jgi:uncharacterized protein (TIGR02453 family)
MQGTTPFPTEGLRFLRSLKRNNNREWFLKHKSIYDTYVKGPIDAFIEEIAHEFQKFAPEMVASPKASGYRIYRDTRFSADKTPYKTQVAAVFPRSGLGKHEGAGYYLHISTTELLIGGGLYMPLPEDLRAIRSYIAERAGDFKRIVEGKQFLRLFGTLGGERLVRVPRGFPEDHPAAEYLKYKQFLAARTFAAEVATTPRFYRLVVDTFKGMLPIIRFLNEPLIKARRVRERQQAMLD